MRATGLTYDDLWAFPDDHRRRELFDGVLVVTPPPALAHDLVVARLLRALIVWSGDEGWTVLAGAGVYQDARNYVEPDVAVLAPDYPRDELGEHARHVARPPALVVEVSSPATQRRDITTKAAWYARFGVPEYWFADRERRTVVAHRLRGADYATDTLIGEALLTSEALPGFALPLQTVFRPDGSSQ